MSYKSCKFIQGGIAFKHDVISFCNKLCGTKRYENFNIPYEGDFYNKYIEIREKAIENCKKGILPHEGCRYCPYVEDKDWDEDTRFREFEITHWIHCNCSCCYCSLLSQTKGKITRFKTKSPYLQLFPIIKRMLKEGRIHPEAFFSIVGGELTVLKEFPDIMKLLLKQKNANYAFCLHTNAIKYEKLLSEAVARNSRTCVSVSVDAGSRDLFKRMKKIDAYNDVIKNLKRYIQDAKKSGNDNRIVVKYIIVPNVNDNKEEIDKWIKTCKDIGVKTLQPAIEFCSHIITPGTFKEKQGILYEYMKEQIVVNGFDMITYDFLEDIVKNKSFDLTIKSNN